MFRALLVFCPTKQATPTMPERDFSADGLVERLEREGCRIAGKKVLRLRSAKAPHTVAAAIRRMGAKVDDVVLYDNAPVCREGVALPKFDAVFFASTSGVEAFIEQYGTKALSRKEIFAIGGPTRNALPPKPRAKARLLPLALPQSFGRNG